MDVVQLPIESLEPNPWNVNRMSRPMMRKLTAYLKREGLVEPIVVRPHPEDEGRYQIDLIGISRFEVVQEIATDKLYRMVEPRWRNFVSDIGNHSEPETSIDREELVANLKAYFETRGLEANWKAIDASGNEELVNSLAMVCPFDPAEKQALLEARDLEERSKLVIALMNMAVLWNDSDAQTLH